MNSKFTFTSKKKDKDYHENKHKEFVGSGFLSPSIALNAKYYRAWYNGLSNQELQQEHLHLLISNSGNAFPIDAIHTNRIGDHIKTLIGMQQRRMQKIIAKAQSPKAVSRRNNSLARMDTEFSFLPMDMAAQDQMGTPLIGQDRIADKETLEQAKLNYKEKGELLYERLLSHHYKVAEMKYKSLRLYEEAKVSGFCGVHMHIRRGYPEIELLNPGEILLQADSSDPHHGDDKAIAIAKYRAITDVATMWEISDEDLEKLSAGSNKGGSAHPSPIYGMNNLLPMYESGGIPYVLEVTCYWKDIEKRKRVERDVGEEKLVYIQMEDEKTKSKDRVIDTFEVECIRFCTILGGDFVPEGGYGKIKNMYHKPGDSWNKTLLPVVAWTPTGLVKELVPVQRLIDRCFMGIDKAIRNDKGQVIANDVSQIPDKMTFVDQDEMMNVYSQFLYNGAGYATPGNYRQLISLNLSLTESVRYYTDIIQVLVHEMEQIAGLPPVVKGEGIEAHNQKVGTVTNAIGQSTTRRRFDNMGFDRFMERMYEYIAQLFRISLAHDPKKFSHIIGDDLVRFVEEEGDFDFEEYGIHIEVDDLQESKKNAIQQILMSKVQSQQMSGYVGARAIAEDDYKTGLYAIWEEEQRIERRNQQMEQAKMQHESQIAESQQAQMQQMEQMRMQLEQMKMDLQRELLAGKTNADLEKVRISGSQKMSEARLKEDAESDRADKLIGKDLEIADIQARIALESAMIRSRSSQKSG